LSIQFYFLGGGTGLFACGECKLRCDTEAQSSSKSAPVIHNNNFFASLSLQRAILPTVLDSVADLAAKQDPLESAALERVQMGEEQTELHGDTVKGLKRELRRVRDILERSKAMIGGQKSHIQALEDQFEHLHADTQKNMDDQRDGLQKAMKAQRSHAIDFKGVITL